MEQKNESSPSESRKKTVYCVRHGQSMHNHHFIRVNKGELKNEGDPHYFDADLSEEGRILVTKIKKQGHNQVKKLSEEIKSISPKPQKVSKENLKDFRLSPLHSQEPSKLA
jgi:hypothetical protein